MKDVNEIIKINDVVEFFKTIGLEWNKRYFVNFVNKKYNIAKNFDDINDNYFKELRVKKDGELVHNCRYIINSMNFVKHIIGCKKNEKVKTVLETIDYSEQWVKFLAKKHGKDYVDFIIEENKEILEENLACLKTAEEMLKKQLKQNAKEKNNEVKKFEKFKKSMQKLLIEEHTK